MLPHGVPVLCTTATANDRVVADVSAQLGDELVVLRGPLDRERLALDVVALPSPADRLAWLASTIPTLAGSGIVYTLTVDDARRVAAWLQLRGIAAEPYFGDLDTEVRRRPSGVAARRVQGASWRRRRSAWGSTSRTSPS